jgi:amino acid adenylation domain-containing protein
MNTRATFEFPATPTQKALWFIHQLDPSSPAYNIPLAFRVHGPLDRSALQKSFEALVLRHEIFRTVFASRDGTLVQIVRSELRPDWSSTSVRVDGEIDAYCRERAAAFAAQPFVLEKGPLVRILLERFSDSDALLVVVFHHIVIDHLSLGQCSRELSALYQSIHRDGRAEPGEPELQFADYAVWVTEHDDPAELQRKTAIWKRRLEGFSGVLDLPLDFPRPPVQSGRGAELRFALSAEQSAAIRSFSRAEGSSLFVVMLSAFKVLMHHYTGQSDVIVGTPFANRGDQEELERVVGCFINTLPVATTLSEGAAFRQVISAVRESVLEGFEVQEVPLEAIVEAVKPRRDASHNPLFQVGFVLQAPPVELSFEGLTLEDLHTHSGGAMYDLHVWVWERGEILEGLIWYNTDLFRRQTIQAVVRHYQTVLSQVVHEPDREIGTINIATAEERQMIAEWNETAREWPPVESVVGLVTDQCRRTPDAIAVIGQGCSYTYAEIDRRSDLLALHLVARGVRPGSLVAVSLDRDADLLVGLLGILKTGAAYVPLDPDYPRERLRFMLDQSSPLALVTEQRLLSILPDYECNRVLLDAHWAEIEQSPAVELPRLSPDLRMYVIYTSGSTGMPKGVQLTHYNVINFLRSMAEIPGLTAEQRLLAVTTLSFDIAVLELYLPLTVGATVMVAPREASSDGHRLKHLLEETGATVMQATPSTWRLLLGSGWKPRDRFRAFCGGEALPQDVAEQLLATGVELWNLYGPTETTVWSTCGRISDVANGLTIGRPIANTTIHILNNHRNVVPPGIGGEVYIGGAGVASGYLHRPDLTAERFVSNPFSSGLMYRTGDLARYRRDGDIEYLNRVDTQVKVRGFRIELGEIEAVLARHDAVAEAVVVAREYSAADRRLVAYVRFAAGRHLTNTELRRYLREYLPDYMIPQFLVELDAMPRTPNGKIDRKSLPDPLHHSPVGETVIPPRTDAEKRLATIWEKTLSVEKVGIDRNFFELGGHSLLAMQVVFHVEEEFGIRMNPRELILNTLEQLAARLEAASGHLQDPAPPARSPGLLGRMKERFGL